MLDRTEHPAECIRFITFMFTEESQRNDMYGLEGLGYTIEYNEMFDREMMTPTSEYTADATQLSAEDLRMKYGNLIPWKTTFRTSYGQNWASVPQIVIEENGVKKQYGEMLINIGELYGSPFKTGNLTMNLTDTDQLLLKTNVEEAWSNNIALCVLADDFEAAYDKMLADMETVGLSELEEIYTERYWQYDDMLQETRNDKWNDAAAR